MEDGVEADALLSAKLTPLTNLTTIKYLAPGQ